MLNLGATGVLEVLHLTRGLGMSLKPKCNCSDSLLVGARGTGRRWVAVAHYGQVPIFINLDLEFLKVLF